ncbi:MAG: ATP-binding protein [Candidatus Omnitrophica bacterium]|nr:ATP-binding protein [Candidatus Omnitrophota bacterium]
MQTIFFFYGLAFIVMGVVIFAMPKKNDLLGLSEDLWLVGLFGILHGLNEWVDLFILRASFFNVEVLRVLGALLLPLSFAPMLQFGVRTLSRGTRFFSPLKYLWIMALVGWAVACFLTPGFLIPGIVARYFFSLPGAILTAAGLFRAFLKTHKKIKIPATVSVGVISAVAGFVFYGVLSGLVVPKADFLLASFINYPNFLQVVGIPVQFFRMICAILLAASFFALTGIYALGLGGKRVKRRGGIQRKITLMLCGFSCVAALLIVGLVSAWSYQSMLANIKQEQLRTARMLSQSVNEMIDQEIEDLEVHLSSGAWQQAVEEANLSYSEMSPEVILKNMQEADRKWIPAKEDNAFIKSYLERPMSLRLKNLMDADKSVAEIFLTDRYGGLVAAAGKTTDFYQADEAWWQKAYAGGKGEVFLGEVAMDESSGVLSILMAIPVRDKSGEVIGVAKESINVDVFFSALKSYKYGKTGHAALIDSKGNTLYHEGVKPLSTRLLSEEEMRTIIQNKTELIRKEEGIHRHATILVSAEKLDSPFLLKDGIVWYLCVSQEVEEIFKPLKEFIAKGMALSLILLAFAILFGIIIGDRLAKPIRGLQKATERIMAGEMNYRIELWTGDEIQEFAESFNDLIERLQEKQKNLLSKSAEIEALSHGLEKKVEERTKDLSESQRATMNILEDLTTTKEELEIKARELQKSEEFLENTGSMAKVGGWEIDLATKGVSWTDETYRIHELEVGDVQSLEAAIHYYTPESAPVIREALRKAAKTGESFDLELELIPAKTKKRIWVRAFGKSVYQGGKIVKLQGTFQNIDLAKLDRLKDDFVSIVAHELRNPLGVVREAAALILDGLVGPVSEDQKKYIEMIKHTGDRLIHITTDLLDLAKIESGKIVVNYEKIDLLSVVRQSSEGIALRAQKKGIALLEDFPGEKLEIMGDFDKLFQVMTNLLNNAVKFTEKGSITVEIKDLGDEVRCAVKDTGPGISRENLTRLFSKFEQFGKPTTSAEKGSGLGLVIAKSIVEAHGGSMGAESELGKGSAFFFVLPKQQKQKKNK